MLSAKPVSKLPKAERVTKPHKLIKHAPPRVFKYSNLVRTLYIKSSTPFVSLIKRIDKKFRELEQPKNKKSNTTFVSVFGMGRNIDKCLSIGLYFQDERKLKIEILTKTINVMDEFEFETVSGDEDDEVLPENEYRKRAISGVEIRIHRE